MGRESLWPGRATANESVTASAEIAFMPDLVRGGLREENYGRELQI